MLAKFTAAVLMPIIAVVLVAGILNWTHHTTVPPLSLPERHRAPALSAQSAAVKAKTCEGKLPDRFSGIAVKSDPARTAQEYTSATGSKPTVVEFYNKFTNPFVAAEAKRALAAGEIPLIQLNPRGVSLQKVAEGAYDGNLKKYAAAVKAFGCTIILSFGHEMNGWWYPWGYPKTTPKEFIAAWRHIHDIFTQEGVANVLWSWDPSHQYQHVAPGKVATPASEWYPGSKYVDLVGLDGYLGYETVSRRPQTFAEIFGPQLRYIHEVAPNKAVYLAETGVAPGPDAASQIKELFAEAASNHLHGLLWFDAKARHDYRLGVFKVTDAAYKSALAGYLAGHAG